MLEPSIQVYSDVINLAERLYVSSGTEYADYVEAFTNHPYDGYIPRKPWRAIASDEAKILIASSPPKDYIDSIAIGRIPAEIQSLAAKLTINASTPQRYFQPNAANPHYIRFKQALLAYLQNLIIRTDGLEVLPIYCGKKNLATTTFDYRKQTFTGLHYDDWDRMAWTKRSHARNRICINLGIEERYFLFVNLSVPKIQAKLARVGFAEIAADQQPDHLLFTHFPDYPVIKIKLDPGDYYIAPTENVIHDGCTEDKTYNDLLLTVLGYFHTRGMTNST